MPDLVSDLLSGGLSIIGGLFGNSAKSKEAQKNRDFQERMARNAHQYEVEDLKAAGLNPALSAMGGNGAATPSGSTAAMDDPFTPAVSSALQSRRINTEVKQIQAMVQKMSAETNQIKQDTEVKKETEELIKQQQKTEGLHQNVIIPAQAMQYSASARQARAAADQSDMQTMQVLPGIIRLNQMQAEHSRSSAEAVRWDNYLRSLQSKEREQEAKAYTGWPGELKKSFETWLKALNPFGGLFK
jgi:hypothetical protein